MEIPLCGRRPRPARRRDGRRRRHFGVERHPRSGQLGVAGTRHADLRQHALRIRHDRSRAAAPARGDSGRRLPPHLHRSRSVGGTQGLPDDRRRQIGRLRLCQRPRSGLQRRFEESGAIPHRPPPASGREYAGAQNDAVEHRFLPRSARLLARRATNCSIPRAAPSPRDGSRQRAKPCSVPRYPTQRTGRPKRPTATGS